VKYREGGRKGRQFLPIKKKGKKRPRENKSSCPKENDGHKEQTYFWVRKGSKRGNCGKKRPRLKIAGWKGEIPKDKKGQKAVMSEKKNINAKDDSKGRRTRLAHGNFDAKSGASN